MADTNSKPDSAVSEILDTVMEDRGEFIGCNPNDRAKTGLQPLSVAVNAVLRNALARLAAKQNRNSNMSSYPLPVELLLQDRWDDAADRAWELTKGTVPATEFDEVFYGLLAEDGPPPTRDTWATEIDRLITFLDDEKLVHTAIAWRMLRADPADPLSVIKFLPQLQVLADQMTPSADKGTAKRRLYWWREAANGEHVESDVSIFRIAAVEDARRAAELREANSKPVDEKKTALPVWAAEAEAERQRQPGIVVIPKDGATKLSRDQHGDYREMVGQHLPFVLAPDLAEVRRVLLSEYPHASREIALLLRDLREGTPIVMKPMLIVGEPGGGKSRVVRRLGEALGLFVYRYDGAAAMDNMFAGVSKSWSSTVPSVPTRSVAMAKSPTAICMVDEIEKAGSSRHNGNMWQAMGGFLERETSVRYRDVSLDCEVNLSYVSHIATANSLDGLPAFLLDRYRVIRWPMPTLAHLPQLAAGVLRDVEKEADEVGYNDPLGGDELEVIGQAWAAQKFSMRRLRRMIEATLDARAMMAPRH